MIVDYKRLADCLPLGRKSILLIGSSLRMLGNRTLATLLLLVPFSFQAR